MKVAVVAANGRSGTVFVKAALAAGMQVRAGIYGTSTLPTHPDVEIVQCDATNVADIDRLVDGVDAVVSLIGHTRRSGGDVQTRATENIIEAMKRHNVMRVISLTGTGVRINGDTPSLIDRCANVAIRLIDPQRVGDGVRHAAVLQQSQLDWTILRVLKLTNGTHNGPAYMSAHGPAELFTPRARVAAAIVELLHEARYIREMPIIIRKGQ